MNRCTRFAIAVALCTGLTAPAAAQTPVLLFAGAGPSIPVGDFGDVAELGWMAGAGVLAVVGQSGLWLGAEGQIGRNSFKDYDTGNWELLGGGGLLGYTIPSAARARPYVFGSVGVLSLKASAGSVSSDSESGLSLGAGAGVTFSLNESASLFASGRFLSAKIDDDRLNIVPITVGFTYMLAGARSTAIRR
jgi:hypothetical protein